jgi:peptide/nickel transport system substrate-binding protein
MKRFVVVGLAVIATACGGERDAAAPATAWDDFCARVMPRVRDFVARSAREHPVPDDDRYGGTVVAAGIAELTGGMSPTATDYVGTQHQQFVNLMTLVTYDADLEPQPYLARSWDVNADSTLLTFHLRTDVYWHDGVRTDAGDVAFTYRLATDPLSAYPNSAYFSYYDTGPDGMQVLDDSTVAVHMRPHVDFMDTWRALVILPAHLLQDVPPEEIGHHPFASQCPVGNGPFVFVEHRPQDRWVFEANPAFPEGLGGRPYLDRLVYRIVPEQTTLLTELLTGSVDLYIGVAPDQAQRVQDAPGVSLEAFHHREFLIAGWNARRPQLADARVRRAITMAVNRREIVDATLHGYGQIANGTVPPFHWAYDSAAVPELPYDPAGSRELLADAGWVDRDGDGVRENSDGVPLHIDLKTNAGNQLRESVAQIMQAQLAKVGIEVRPLFEDPGALTQEIFGPTRDFDGFIISWMQDFRVDDLNLFHSEHIDDPFAMSGTDNPEIDRLLDTLQLVTDREKAQPLWNEYQRLLVREQPYTFLFFMDRIAGIRDRMKGVDMDVRGEWPTVRTWWIDPAMR